ncbi:MULTISPECIES: benzoylformate decarboxylase [unclassified Ornithinimicrobium]|uniref:benzoylformate decarboxylase n=1 Tax=unclassified Ornithinimicrobium TaxID=2615080 RepID=UPI00385453CD
MTSGTGPARHTVRDRSHALLRRHGVSVIFGNPGSNELPFLQDLPDDVDYVLGLHEGAVVGMADGYAQATGRPAFVSLHAASGTGNAMGALTNAVSSHTPLVLLAGQQVRATLGLEPMLANVDAALLTRPLTRWSSEPACATDVPRALNQAFAEAVRDGGGPVYLSVPYDDWDRDAAPGDRHLLGRSVVECRDAPEPVVAGLVERLDAAAHPVLVLGPTLDTGAGYAAGVRLAEALGAAVWVSPSTHRMPFPNRHPLFRGVLPAAVAHVSELLAGHDLVLVAGAPVFRYHQHVPGDYLARGTHLVHLTDDGGEAARAPMGEAVVADVVGTLTRLADGVRPRGVAVGAYTEPAPARAGGDGRLDPEEVFATVRETAPADTAYVVESTSTNAAFWAQMDLRQPQSYFWPASGGLGFGLPAAVGVRMGLGERPVVALVGDGSANYGITALWTAAQQRVPVVFVILNNGTYGALRWFADLLGVPKAPGLDVPGIDFVQLGQGYGVPSARASDVAGLRRLLAEGLASDGPSLIEVPTTLTTPH